MTTTKTSKILLLLAVATLALVGADLFDVGAWLLWGVALMLQNAAFTWTSRSRNSDSLKEHGIASFFSNGVYFFNLAIGVDKITEAKKQGGWHLMAITILFYTAFTMSGAIYSHHLLLKRKKAKAV
jgi:hypothetical protein